jgi:hypothetical protein
MPKSEHPRPYRRGSVYGPGRRRTLDRNQRARFNFLARMHARAGRLSAKGLWIAVALLKRLGADGQCDPTHDTLAADAGCSARTARRALATMKRLGLVCWQTRLVRAGWRAEQTSNAYVLVPTAPLPACGGQIGRQTTKQDSSTARQASAAPRNEALEAFVRAAAAGPDLLARQRAQFAARQRAAMAAG